MKTAQRKKEETSTRVKHKGLVLSCSMSESEEWWFDVRPKGVGKKRPCPIDDLCSESSKSSSAPDATMARWYEAFETRVTASQSTHRSEWPSSLRNKASRERIQTFGCRPDVRVSTRRLSEQWISVGASLVAAVMSTFFKSQLSTVHRVFCKLGRWMPYA